MSRERPRFLVSFHYYREVNLDKLVTDCGGDVDLFADSGAFSAASLGADVTLDAYAAWLAKWRHLFTAYANLDVIGNPAATLANQVELEARGFTPLPVFHYGSPWGYLERYCVSHDYIALGGLVGRTKRTTMPWLVRAFQIAKTAPKPVRYHGFGVTGHDTLTDLPWYSADSSSWASGYRYGNLRLFDPKLGRFKSVRCRNRQEVFAYADLLRSMGADPNALLRCDRNTIIQASVASIILAERYLGRRFGTSAIYLAERDTAHVRQAASAHLYCADANPERVRVGAGAARLYLASAGGNNDLDLHTAASAVSKVANP